MKRYFFLFLACCFLLTGCAAIDNIPKPPKVTPVPAAEAVQETASPAAEVPDASSEPAAEPTAEPTPSPAVQKQGFMIHFEHNVREVFDPESGTERILTFAWDDVRVESDAVPEAAAKVTEALAALEDEWYTGSNGGEGDFSGFDAMLSAAEDNYGIAREFGGEMECSATRDISVIRADDEVLVFELFDYYFLGGAHGSYDVQTVCFDAKTGDQLSLETLSGDSQALKDRLLSEMLRLAAEDQDSYYSDRLDLTAPEDYETAFKGLLRDGSWSLGTDAFSVSSDLYELGSYAAGITTFRIPYESLSEIPGMDRWIPQNTDETGTVRIAQLSDVPDGSVEIVDRVVIGEGGETFLLVADGCVKDFRIRSAYYGDRFYPERELYYCGSLRDAAVQLALLLPEEMPDTMVSYRDASGEHEYVISYSAAEGTAVLTENEVAVFG
ncbi:MAG: hypothetical protein IJQ02_02240 [Oscillospiraceae bacterium]|nr:hypothetical protein [Oscillospiraceae bacterium]